MLLAITIIAVCAGATWVAARFAGLHVTSTIVALLALGGIAYAEFAIVQWYEPLAFLLGGLWLGGLPVCAAYGVWRTVRQRTLRASSSLLAPTLAVVLAMSGLLDLSTDQEFHMRRSSREQVVDLVKQRVVTPDNGSQQVATLPGSLPVVACCGNKILILGDGPKVAFPTELGFELFMGVVYAPDDDPLTLFDGAGRIEKNFGDHWYYVVGD